MNMVGTPCSAVHLWRAIAASVASASKLSPGKHHGGADRGAAQHAEHHAEAMIERHRNAQPVARGQRHRLGAGARIVDDVEMGERRALRRAGGAGGELDIDGIVGVERGGQPVEAGAMRRPGDAQGNRRTASRPAAAAHRRARSTCRRCGSLSACKRVASAAVDLRRERAHHGEIVARLQRARHDQHFALHLVERVFELGALIGRVDVDQDRADARGAELR